MNKANRLNRTMMVGTMFLAILLFGLVSAFLYVAYGYQEAKTAPVASSDSLVIIEETATSETEESAIAIIEESVPADSLVVDEN